MDEPGLSQLHEVLCDLGILEVLLRGNNVGDINFQILIFSKSVKIRVCQFSCCTADSQNTEDQNQLHNNLKFAKLKVLAKPW